MIENQIEISRKGKEVRMKSQQDIFAEICALIVEGQRREFEATKAEAIRDFIEKVNIDLWEILGAAKVVEDLCGKDASYYNFQGWFYSQWKFGCPPDFVDFFETKLRLGDVLAKHLREEICAYGSKLKAVVGGLCVSPNIKIDCENCYFASVCQQKQE